MDSNNKKIGDNTYKISDHVPFAVGFSWGTKGEAPNNGNYKSYSGPDCIKDDVKDLFEIETENNFKLNNPMIFNKEDKLYHEANQTCHICNKPFINKVRDHCHQTCPAFNICNLKSKQQNFIPVLFHNGKVYDLNLIFNEIFKQNNNKRRVDVLLSTNS